MSARVMRLSLCKGTCVFYQELQREKGKGADPASVSLCSPKRVSKIRD